MNTLIFVILAIFAILIIMYLFGGNQHQTGCSSGVCNKKVRFADSCSGDTCGL